MTAPSVKLPELQLAEHVADPEDEEERDLGMLAKHADERFSHDVRLRWPCGVAAPPPATARKAMT